ncbi:hypothetical protein FOA52_008780 [Chlamydomonas sp. UWO 241]|nr:hypothetical protein FOA52_008780 [Chlamydomonas sp. UWO 241]
MSKSVLIVCTSHDKLGTADDAAKTGSWMEELAAPYYAFLAKGYTVTVASIKGGVVPFDDASLNPPFVTPDVEKFRSDETAMLLVTKSKVLSEVKAVDFDAVLLPGGHGVCWDLPDNADLIAQLSAAYQAGKVVAALCHGPFGLVNIKDAAGQPIVKGKKVTGFSNAEEIAVGKDGLVPFMLETRLKELGGDYTCGENWAAFAVRDGNLVTGQNPSSGAETARLMIEALSC